MLVQQGNARNFAIDRRLACTLAAVAGIYALVILVEACGMAILGYLQEWLDSGPRKPFVVLGLACHMGVQNAVVTRISEAHVRTAHVSGMATDIGIEIGLLINSAFRRGLPSELAAVRARLQLHFETILAFLGGGIVGVALYRGIGGAIFWIAAGFLATISFQGLTHARQSTVNRADFPMDNDL
ncbi:hypothetical protein MMA231_03871 (plasmid) [Asticcacaulis sp. MM231]|uniref:YoaK family protein n=1 Tax=Asticcacaulis sp. MM231 TaxID=3157666 RepID=UPI0032D56DDF